MKNDHDIRRRDFLARVAATGMLEGAGVAGAAFSAFPVQSPCPLIDTHVYLFQWPFRRLPNDEPAALASHLKSRGVTAAWAGSFEAVFRRDMASANGRLWEECERHGRDFFTPCGTVDPTMPDWQEDFRKCLEDFRMRIIRLFPAYHGYGLDTPEFGQLLHLAERSGVGVQIVLEMEDIRAQHPLLTVKPVDAAPLSRWLNAFPGLRIMLLNCHRAATAPDLAKLFSAGRVYADLGMLEGMAGLERLAAILPERRICFGSFAPMFYLESALLKLTESQLSHDSVRAICRDSAAEFLEKEAPRSKASESEGEPSTHPSFLGNLGI